MQNNTKKLQPQVEHKQNKTEQKAGYSQNNLNNHSRM